MPYNLAKMFLKIIPFRNEPLLMLPPRVCLTVHPSCFNMTNTSMYETSPELEWMDVTNYICYLLLPMVVFFSLLGQVVNIIILTNQIRVSLDTYLLAMSMVSFLQVCFTVIICLPYYIGHFSPLVHVQYYSMICREWFCHIGLWLLISLSLERSVTFTLHKTYVSGTSTQAWIIMVIVTSVGFISTLPRLWEYNLMTEVTSHQNSNVTVASVPIIQRTAAADGAGFAVIYFWYLTSIFVILPLFLMLAACIPLCYSTDRISSRNFSSKCSTNTAVILNRRIVEDIALTKLVIILITLYLLLSTPLISLHILAGLVPEFVKMDSPPTITIQNILTILYHLYFVLHQQFYFCYNKQYRLTLLTMCCCCC